MRLTFFLFCLVATPVFAASEFSLGAPRLGSGFVRPVLEHAVYMNPAALGGAPAAVEGGWAFERDRPHLDAVANYRGVGFGGGYRRDGISDVFEVGVGLDISPQWAAGLAFNLYEKSLDGHAAITYRVVPSVMLGLVTRYIASGITRLDFGAAYLGRGFQLEGDYKQVIREGEKAAYFNFGAATQVDRLGLSLGFDFNVYKGEFRGGTLQAGLGFDVANGWTVRGFYRPEPYESGAGDWLLSVRAAL